MIDIELLDIDSLRLFICCLRLRSYQSQKFSIDPTLCCTVMDMPFKRTHFQLTQRPGTLRSTNSSAYIIKFEEQKCQLLMGDFFFTIHNYSSVLVLEAKPCVRLKSGQGRGDYGTKSRLSLQTPASLLIYK